MSNMIRHVEPEFMTKGISSAQAPKEGIAGALFELGSTQQEQAAQQQQEMAARAGRQAQPATALPPPPPRPAQVRSHTLAISYPVCAPLVASACTMCRG